EGGEGGLIFGGGDAVGGHGDVGPAGGVGGAGRVGQAGVGAQDGAVERFVQGAQLEDAGVVLGGIFQGVVGLGQALPGVAHVGGAGFVQALADGLELGDDAAGIGDGEREGFEAVGGGVVQVRLHRRR